MTSLSGSYLQGAEQDLTLFAVIAVIMIVFMTIVFGIRGDGMECDIELACGMCFKDYYSLFARRDIFLIVIAVNMDLSKLIAVNNQSQSIAMKCFK